MTVRLTKEEVESGLYKPHTIYTICTSCRAVFDFIVMPTGYHPRCSKCQSVGTFDIVEVIDEAGV